MTAIERIEKALRKALPDARIEVDLGEGPRGVSWLDARRGRAAVSIESRPGRGFGLTGGRTGLVGEGSHEFFADPHEAASRAIELLEAGQRTRPLRAVLLKELRVKRRVTQEQLARALHVKQATVSRMESRGDLQLSTLQRIVTALGGTLELRATFPGASFRIATAAPRKRTRATKRQPAR